MKWDRNNNNSFFSPALGRFLLLAFITIHSIRSFGQLTLVPLGAAEAGIGATQNHEAARISATVNLPFFEDFSSVRNGRPHESRWVAGSGVYINNTLSRSHPSLQMATFDGLDASGMPYNDINPLAQNFTDTLTSQPVNLAGKSAADSVYLSFYWMAKGLGERPDSSDFFRLEFLSNTNEWVTVWNQTGYQVDTLFHQQFVKISEARYFHNAFQFRFRAYGRSSGAYDTWHLDYIYLNTRRSVRQPYLFDVAMRLPVTPLLKKYTAMPLRQYRVSPQSNLSETVKTDIVNHFNNFNVLTSTFTITDAQRNTELFRNTQRSVYIESLKTKALEIKPTLPVINTSLDSINLLCKYFVTTTDTIPGVNLKQNDTISSRVALSDYYAYDDGTAEYGIQVNQKLGRAAVQYVFSKPDTIGGVRLALVPFDKDISGQNFTIQILSSKNGKPDQVLTQRSVVVNYSGGRNAFRDFAFNVPVAVQDTFYVAWMQINEQPVTMGFDRNSRLGSQAIYYNLGSEWVKDNSLAGSIMIRPYLGSKAQGVITGGEPDSKRPGLYPNPTTGLLRWDKANIRKLEIYSVGGALIETIMIASGQDATSIEHLADGMYIVRGFMEEKGGFTQKILLAR